MLVYVGLFSLLVLCHCVSTSFLFNNKRRVLQKLIAIVIPLIFIVLISTFKSNSVGTDTPTYYDLYIKAKSEPSIITRNFANFSVGFSTLFISFAKFGLPFKIFQLFLYTLIYSLFGIILWKRSKYPTFSIIVFCLWSWLFFDFSGLRQGLSDMMCLFALFVLAKKEPTFLKNVIRCTASFCILCAAYLVHTSALIFMVVYGIYLLCVFVKNIRLILLLMIPAIFCVFMMSYELYQAFFYFLNINFYIPTYRPGVGKLFFFYFALFALFVILYCEKSNNFLNNLFSKFSTPINERIRNKKYSFIVNNGQVEYEENLLDTLSILLFGIGVGIQSFSGVCYSMLRLGNPFLLVGVLLIPNLVAKNKNKLFRIVLIVGLIFALALVFYVDYYRTNQLNGFPYSFSFR